MTDDVRPPLRHYRQMVRVVKDEGQSYKLANAYGVGVAANSTDLRMRTLDEMGMPSESPRRPAPNATGGEFDKRVQTIHYHDLNARSRSFFNGVSPPIISRNDSLPGTKERTDLGVHSFSKKIEPLINLSPMETPVNTQENDKTQNKTKNKVNSGSKPSPDKGSA